MNSRVALFQQPQFYFAAALAVSVVAFWPQLFSQLTTIDTAHLVHGLTATAWMAIPVVQAWLVAHRRFEAHRYLGRIWLLIADWRRAKPVSAAYAAVLAFFVTGHAFATPVSHSPVFQRFASWFATL